jgi:hypothetical protein
MIIDCRLREYLRVLVVEKEPREEEEDDHKGTPQTQKFFLARIFIGPSPTS